MFVLRGPIDAPKNPHEQKLSIVRELIRENHNYKIKFDDEDLVFRHEWLRKGVEKLYLSGGFLLMCYWSFTRVRTNPLITKKQKVLGWSFALMANGIYLYHEYTHLKLDALDYVSNKYLKPKGKELNAITPPAEKEKGENAVQKSKGSH